MTVEIGLGLRSRNSFLGIQKWDLRCSASHISPVPFPVPRPYLVSFPMTKRLKFNTALEMRWFWLVSIFTSIDNCKMTTMCKKLGDPLVKIYLLQ
jgi:hypothetical protein